MQTSPCDDVTNQAAGIVWPYVGSYHSVMALALSHTTHSSAVKEGMLVMAYDGLLVSISQVAHL